MSSGSTGGTGLDAGDGGTLRYLTCSTRRAARAPLRRRMPTGQRPPARPGLSSPPPPSLILRTHAFTTMHPTPHYKRATETELPPENGSRDREGSDSWEAVARKNGAHDCAPRATDGGGERTRRRRAVTSRLISTPVSAGTLHAGQAPGRREAQVRHRTNNNNVYTAQCTTDCTQAPLACVITNLSKLRLRH